MSTKEKLNWLKKLWLNGLNNSRFHKYRKTIDSLSYTKILAIPAASKFEVVYTIQVSIFDARCGSNFHRQETQSGREKMRTADKPDLRTVAS